MEKTQSIDVSPNQKGERVKKIIVICLVSWLGCLNAYCQPTENLDRAKRWGLGTNFSGPSVRYWFTNSYAIDGEASFSYDDSDNRLSKGYGAGISMVALLKQKGGLRFEGIFGGGYSTEETNQSSTTTRQEEETWSASLSLGLGVEYSFQELPDLSFGAFTTGIGFVHEEEDDRLYIDGAQYTSSSDVNNRFSTSPSAFFTVRYYF